MDSEQATDAPRPEAPAGTRPEAPGEPRPEARNDTPERLLRAAEMLVVQEGVHALTVRRIANAAQVNSALIRYHFGGTDGLLRELALRNGARIADARQALLDEPAPADAFAQAVDALVLPLWTEAAMSGDYRAIVVLDEIFARAGEPLHDEIWALFAQGVARTADALAACLPGVDAQTLSWRIRFVTAAALDVPPRSARVSGATVGRQGQQGDRLAAFRAFAAHALRA